MIYAREIRLTRDRLYRHNGSPNIYGILISSDVIFCSDELLESNRSYTLTCAIDVIDDGQAKIC